jgi:hypothetical protein
MSTDTEMTPIGEQTLIAGVRPITARDRFKCGRKPRSSRAAAGSR